MNFKSLAVGFNHICGIGTDSRAYCWGDNSSGELGIGTIDDRLHTPAAIVSSQNFTAVAAGYDFTCALTSAGAAICWGLNYLGSVGSGSVATLLPTPTNVIGGVTFTAISAGNGNTVCGVTTTSDVWCWGQNDLGQLGNGTSDALPHPTPTRVTALSGVRSLAVGWRHSCAVTTAGGLCWGANDVGQLGTATSQRTCIDEFGDGTPCTTVPQAVTGGGRFRLVAVGDDHSCGIDSDGFAFCWGSNLLGQLGNSSIDEDSATPVPVDEPSFNDGFVPLPLRASIMFHSIHAHVIPARPKNLLRRAVR